MVRWQLRDEPWSRVERTLLSQQRTGRRGRDDRNVIEAVLGWRRTGVPWRDLPKDFGSWKTVFNRFVCGSKDGRWSRLFKALRVDPDVEYTFNLLKQPRRFVTRYEEDASSRAADSVAEPHAVRESRRLSPFETLPAPSAMLSMSEGIREMAAPARQTLDHAVGKDEKVQREVVDIEPFVVESLNPSDVGRFERLVASAGHGHGHGHGKTEPVQGHATRACGACGVCGRRFGYFTGTRIGPLH
jgi:transposase